MTPADIDAIRMIFREELKAIFAGQTLETVQLEADHMARMIMEGRGAEVKAMQRQKLGLNVRRKAA